MKGKEHMIVGTTATATMGIGLVINNNIGNVAYLIPLVIGGFIGSYMPDIDSRKSKASQVFNKLIMILVVALLLGNSFGLALSIDDIVNIFKYTSENYIGLIFFCINTILGKLSPHRMYTHKILGTIMFCWSVYLIGNKYLALGFTTGYILHIVCDRFSPRGKNLKFFELKLPCRNSKNKTAIDW